MSGDECCHDHLGTMLCCVEPARVNNHFSSGAFVGHGTLVKRATCTSKDFLPSVAMTAIRRLVQSLQFVRSTHNKLGFYERSSRPRGGRRARCAGGNSGTAPEGCSEEAQGDLGAGPQGRFMTYLHRDGHASPVHLPSFKDVCRAKQPRSKGQRWASRRPQKRKRPIPSKALSAFSGSSLFHVAVSSVSQLEIGPEPDYPFVDAHKHARCRDCLEKDDKQT